MSAMLRVISQGAEYRIPFPMGLSVREILDATSVRVRSACGGGGACGQCRIRVADGEVTPPTATEEKRLGRDRLAQGMRLACQVRPRGDLRVLVDDPAPASAWRSFGEADGLPAVTARKTEGERRKGDCAAAVDLGTTQIRVSVLDRGTGRRLAGRSGLNPQARFGADVLTRLTAAAASEDRADEIGRAAREAIGAALGDIFSREGIEALALREVAIVGNTAMLCLLTGKSCGMLLDPNNWMGRIDCAMTETSSFNAGWGLAAGTRLEVLEPLAGFVGSDLLAGILATGLPRGPAGSLLIDFGTNSEMALWDGETIWVTSAAGGPAFEGCGISCGMPAEPGAIFRVAEAAGGDGGFACSVLGGGRPKGLCGSGLVDAVACLVRRGALKANGRIVPVAGGPASIAITGGLALTNQDIDALQRAKAAIGAGVRCLMARAGMSPADLPRRLCICGAFGRHLDLEAAQALGLLPILPRAHVELWGNTALAGCEQWLTLGGGEGVLEPLRQRCQIVNLSIEARFEDFFVEHLSLRPMTFA